MDLNPGTAGMMETKADLAPSYRQRFNDRWKFGCTGCGTWHGIGHARLALQAQQTAGAVPLVHVFVRREETYTVLAERRMFRVVSSRRIEIGA